MPYQFKAYDVLQIQRNGEWLDFATLRTPADADDAVRLVRSGRWEGETFAFRITAAFAPGVVKLR